MFLNWQMSAFLKSQKGVANFKETASLAHLLGRAPAEPCWKDCRNRCRPPGPPDRRRPASRPANNPPPGGRDRAPSYPSRRRYRCWWERRRGRGGRRPTRCRPVGPLAGPSRPAGRLAKRPPPLDAVEIHLCLKKPNMCQSKLKSNQILQYLCSFESPSLIRILKTWQWYLSHCLGHGFCHCQLISNRLLKCYSTSNSNHSILWIHKKKTVLFGLCRAWRNRALLLRMRSG